MKRKSLFLLRMKRKRKQQQFIMIVMCSLFFGVWLWYSCVYIRQPEYSLNQLKASIENNDKDAFAKYLNLDLLMHSAYADLTVDLFPPEEKTTKDGLVITRSFYTRVSPQIIDATKNLILDRVESGKWLFPSGNNIMKGSNLGIDLDWLVECSLLRSTEIKGIENIKKDGDTATADLLVLNTTMNVPFSLILSLEKQENGKWQVVGIANYRAYLTAIIPLIHRDLSNYIDATDNISNAYVWDFITLREQFQLLARRARASFNPEEKEELRSIIADSVIPLLNERQYELNQIKIPPGASYLANLRISSTSISIKAWETFLKGIENNDLKLLNEAASLHKREMEIDTKIEHLLSLF